MAFSRFVVLLVLALLPEVVLSQPPFTFNGLHVDLVLADAVAQTEKLGGQCESAHLSGSQDEGASIQCKYEACAESDSASECDTTSLAAVAGLPIVGIGLEAPDQVSPLTRIVIFYDGDPEVVAATLRTEFGPTDVDGAPTEKSSWSHARRWSWTQGQYRAGLLNAPKMIILAVDRAQE
jgi:hypothetical protein